jgi:hypothetical protein
MQTVEKHVVYTNPPFSAQKPGGLSLWLTLVHLGTSADCQQLSTFMIVSDVHREHFKSLPTKRLRDAQSRIPHSPFCLYSTNIKATHCGFPSYISSLSCRRRCICPWGAFPARSASPSSTCPPSSCSIPSSPTQYRGSRQCRQHFGGARAVGTSGGGRGARGFSFAIVSRRF